MLFSERVFGFNYDMQILAELLREYGVLDPIFSL
jgi:hypothetical protein